MGMAYSMVGLDRCSSDPENLGYGIRDLMTAKVGNRQPSTVNYPIPVDNPLSGFYLHTLLLFSVDGNNALFFLDEQDLFDKAELAAKKFIEAARSIVYDDRRFTCFWSHLCFHESLGLLTD